MSSERNKRIAKNTLMLYFRQLLILFVSLYTIRIVLDELGVEDYGVYAAIGGLVALSAFLPGSLAQATQRFFSFAMGEQDDERLKKTFSVNLALYASVAALAFILLQTIGLWFVDNHLAVPDDRFEAARTLYHYATLTFLVGIFTTPFMSIIMAHEDMKLYAYISIIEALMKLGAVFLLQYIAWDKLELYGLLLLCVGIINSTAYIGTCVYRYDECQFRKVYWDSSLLKEIIGFTSWTVFGQVTNVARTHAVTLLLNQYFNPAVVAARAIAVQIASKVDIFSSNFNTSLYPPIIKSYASNHRDEMIALVIGGSKITFYLLWIFALPMILQMEFILELWLTNVPHAASLFAQLSLIEALILAISLPLTVAARAPGKMRGYELTLGSIQLGLFLAAWFFVSQGAPAYSVFLVAIAANLVMFFVRLLLLKMLLSFPVLYYIKSSVIPVLIIVLITSTPMYLLSESIPISFLSLILLTVVSFSLTSLAFYYLALDERWRKTFRERVFSKFSLGAPS